MFVPFCHDTLHIGTQKQVFHTDLYLLDMLHLDDMADIGRGKPVNLLHLLHGVVAFIVHEVGSAEKYSGKVTWDELGLPVTETGLALPCGATGRWFSE